MIENNKKIYTCMNDVMFKTIFKNKENLAFYVNSITNNNFSASDIDEISNEIKTSIRSKGVIYDVCVGIDNNIFVDMEAQNRVDNEMALKRRMVHYSSIIYSKIYNPGSIYKENHRTIVIFLVNDRYEKGKYYELLQFKDQDNESLDLQMIYKINIPLFIKNFKTKTDNDKLLLEGLELLISDEFEKYNNSKNPNIRRVALEIMKLNEDEKARINMDMAEAKAMQDRLEKEDIRKDGIKQGQEEERINNIKTMYNNGADINTISKLLGLEKDYIKKILENS